MASWAHNDPRSTRLAGGASGVATAQRQGLWAAVDELIDRATSLPDLEFHRLHLLAARRWRATGRLVPRNLRDAERSSAILSLVAPAVLKKAREAYDRTIVLMKGPEIACKYPDPALRPFGDLDLLVPDAAEAQRALLAAGFVRTGAPELYVDIHHVQPLQWPGSPLSVELHDRPKWIDGLPAPSRAELLASAVGGSTGVPGVLALSPELHAIAIAAHSWAHAPLARLGHLLDLAAVTDGLDRAELELIATRLGIRRPWRASIAASDALFADGPRTRPLRLWGRNLEAVRERTVLEAHLGRWLAPWWALGAGGALRSNAFTLSRELWRLGDEPWTAKLRRTRRALRHASRRLSDHQRTLGEEGP
ncbi:MAG TPA: nucleotidyltransferase family protein [Gaiellaceae bacterium]